MAYVTAEARQELLDTVAEAADELAVAIAALGDAYEQLDEAGGDRLEEQLFGPVQRAYGRARRTHSEFAARYGLPPREFKPGSHQAPSSGVKGFVEAAADAVDQAEAILVELQNSMSPVEVGDAELRAGLAEVRETLADVLPRTERFISGFGR